MVLAKKTREVAMYLIEFSAELDAECALHLAEDGVVGDGAAALVLVHDGLLLVDARRKVLLCPALRLTPLLDAQRDLAAHVLDCGVAGVR